MTDTVVPPRVWIGTLGLHNAGHLIGAWFDAVDAPQDVWDWMRSPKIEPQVRPFKDDEIGEELWCFDHEGFPPAALSEECSPMEASRVAEVLEDLGSEADAYCAWVDTFRPASDFGDDVDEFRDAYAGEWDSERDFAENLAEELGLLPREHTWPTSYIDWDQATRDLFMDYASVPAPGGRVYVFRAV